LVVEESGIEAQCVEGLRRRAEATAQCFQELAHGAAFRVMVLNKSGVPPMRDWERQFHQKKHGNLINLLKDKGVPERLWHRCIGALTPFYDGKPYVET
jgi:hypothetical protein